jgi:hypothetical protein
VDPFGENKISEWVLMAEYHSESSGVNRITVFGVISRMDVFGGPIRTGPTVLMHSETLICPHGYTIRNHLEPPLGTHVARHPIYPIGPQPSIYTPMSMPSMLQHTTLVHPCRERPCMYPSTHLSPPFFHSQHHL